MLCSGNCCLRDTPDLDMQVKSSPGMPGMQSGGGGLPEPPVATPKKVEEKQPEKTPPPAPAAPISTPTPAPQASEEEDSKPFVFVVEMEKTATVSKVGVDVDHGDKKTLEVMLVKAGLVQLY